MARYFPISFFIGEIKKRMRGFYTLHMRFASLFAKSQYQQAGTEPAFNRKAVSKICKRTLAFPLTVYRE